MRIKKSCGDIVSLPDCQIPLPVYRLIKYISLLGFLTLKVTSSGNLALTHHIMGGDLGLSFGGRKRNFSDQISE